MSKHSVRALAALALLCAAPPAAAEPFDPYLHQKALDYDAWARTWHTTGLGGSTELYFTDETRTEIYRTGGAGDSTDWTTFYLVSQCLRYRITGEQIALDEVERIARYLHLVHTVTESPGYIARYVGYDEAPWNVESVDDPARVEGTGEFAGLFWLGRQSRDKFMHWFWGMAWAWDTLEDPELRTTIRDDMARVAGALQAQNWTIIDPWGQKWSAAEIGPDIRMEILLATAHVTGDIKWWVDLALEYLIGIEVLPLGSWKGLNVYFDFYAFVNDVPVSNTLFRLWPDRANLMRYFNVWLQSTRSYTETMHFALMDAVYYGACLRLGVCDPAQVDAMRADVIHGLTVMPEAPNWQRARPAIPELPIDPFSVFASDLIDLLGIRDLIDIRPQTLEAHTVESRCWATHLWERSPYHIACTAPDDPTHVAPGYDYTLPYWFGVYYGLLPGDGPYEDAVPPFCGTVPADARGGHGWIVLAYGAAAIAYAGRGRRR